ncbi:MAG: hypothetical protein IH988_05445 [Planctomycetes bacterium]|nr:hypothetical protein [Planctomycetota bacterium]
MPRQRKLTPEQVAAGIAALLNDPEFREKFFAFVAESLEWPGADEIKKRIKPLLDADPLPPGYYASFAALKAGKPTRPY